MPKKMHLVVTLFTAAFIHIQANASFCERTQCDQIKSTFLDSNAEADRKLLEALYDTGARQDVLVHIIDHESAIDDLLKADELSIEPALAALIRTLSGPSYKLVTRFERARHYKAAAELLKSKDYERLKKNVKKEDFVNAFGAVMTLTFSTAGTNENIALKSYLQELANKPSSAAINYFNVATTGCSVAPKIQVPFAPKPWPDSKFLIIDATFKNMDSEGRLPVEGAALITYQGKNLKYDHAEPVMADGYGIYLQSVNPLLTMRTKLVYRVPDEVYGDVYWQPGRNPKDQKLWCGQIPPPKK